MINSGTTVPCPNCYRLLEDVRDKDDRIDFWCNTCHIPFNETFLEIKEILNKSSIEHFKEIK